jgi:hypothetical protein
MGRDWEASAARRLQHTIDGLVSRMRDTANQIEREAKYNITAAAKGETEYATYARAAGQALHELHTLVFNVNAANIIDAAHDADAARLEKQTPAAINEAAVKSLALSAMLRTVDGWIESTKENHVALDHRGENRGEECWRRYDPSDIRLMVNDTAKDVAIAEFTLPKTPVEDLP